LNANQIHLYVLTTLITESLAFCLAEALQIAIAQKGVLLCPKWCCTGIEN
jgi:hypothetical protein